MRRTCARQRILGAVVALHQEVGPAATTISGIAERAGVQRLTVYRHFPDERALIQGCSAHWNASHPLPDPSAWIGLREPGARLEAALLAMYAWYERGRPMLERVLEDEGKLAALAEVLAPFHGYLADVEGGLAAGWGGPVKVQRLVRIAAGHALHFDSWRSLIDRGLTNHEAARIMASFVATVAGGSVALAPDPRP
jgi:AcrR family transcriptional regulator